MSSEVKVLLAGDGQVARERARGPAGCVAAQRDAAGGYPAGSVRDTAAGEQVGRRHGPRLVGAGQPIKTVQIPEQESI